MGMLHLPADGTQSLDAERVEPSTARWWRWVLRRSRPWHPGHAPRVEQGRRGREAAELSRF